MQHQEYQKYYVPAQSVWPIVGAVALFLIAVGLLLLLAGLVSIYFATTSSGVVQGWTNLGRSIGLPVGAAAQPTSTTFAT